MGLKETAADEYLDSQDSPETPSVETFYCRKKRTVDMGRVEIDLTCNWNVGGIDPDRDEEGNPILPTHRHFARDEKDGVVIQFWWSDN